MGKFKSGIENASCFHPTMSRAVSPTPSGSSDAEGFDFMEASQTIEPNERKLTLHFLPGAQIIPTRNAAAFCHALRPSRVRWTR